MSAHTMAFLMSDETATIQDCPHMQNNHVKKLSSRISIVVKMQLENVIEMLLATQNTAVKDNK